MISACMIVQNEEMCIDRCLSSISDYVDEIIIIDGGSKDMTMEIVKKYPKVRLYEIPFEKHFAKQRNNAIEKANYDWIFVIDADEWCYPYVMEQLRYLITLENDAYKFNRKTLINGHLNNPINPDYTYRFFRSYCRYENNIHENLYGFTRQSETNLEIIHDKKLTWQQKDDELYWEMGQNPPDGWYKIGDKWIRDGWQIVDEQWMKIGNPVPETNTDTDNTLSALLCIYNEGLMLKTCLANLVKFADEIIIVDGSPSGPSDDNSKAIIDEFMANSTAIKYYSGVFAFDDGAWDEPAQINFGLDKVTKSYVMRTHPDIIYDPEDIKFLKKALSSGKKYIYCPQLDFWGDTKHMLLYKHSTIETSLQHQVSIDPLAISMDCNVRAESIRISDNEPRRFGMICDIDYNTDILYLPHIKKYHFGFMKPIADQVRKYVCYAKRGDMGPQYIDCSEKELYDFAVDHVMGGYKDRPGMDYYGYYPNDALPFKNISYMDGYNEFMAWYKSEFVNDKFKKPSKEGYEDFTPEDAKRFAEELAWNWGVYEDIKDKPILGGGSEKRLFDIIKALDRKVSVLDIGCANAIFLIFYTKSGLTKKSVGIDLSENGIENARKSAENNGVELELYAKSIDDFEYAEPFDVIRMTEVLEHVMDVPKVLKKIGSLLADDGIFIGTTPYGNAGDSEAHLHYFVDDDLKNMLMAYFDIVEFEVMDFNGQGENHFFFHCKKRR